MFISFSFQHIRQKLPPLYYRRESSFPRATSRPESGLGMKGVVGTAAKLSLVLRRQIGALSSALTLFECLLLHLPMSFLRARTMSLIFVSPDLSNIGFPLPQT